MQWGLENRTWKSERHSKSERFKVLFSNGKKFGFEMARTIQNPISTSEWRVKHPFAGQNTQQLV